jgi:hypothetical protein
MHRIWHWLVEGKINQNPYWKTDAQMHHAVVSYQKSLRSRGLNKMDYQSDVLNHLTTSGYVYICAMDELGNLESWVGKTQQHLEKAQTTQDKTYTLLWQYAVLSGLHRKSEEYGMSSLTLARLSADLVALRLQIDGSLST